MSLSLGWELIGPELFPMYLIILGLNLTLAIGTGAVIMLYIHRPLNVGALVRTALIQLACVTLTFTILNLVRPSRNGAGSRRCPRSCQRFSA